MLDQSQSYKVDDKLLFTRNQNFSPQNMFESMRAKFYGFRMKNKAIENRKRYDQLAPIHHHIIKDVSRKEFYQQILSQKTGQVWGKVNKSRLARLKRKIQRKIRELKKSKTYIKCTRMIKVIPVINPNNQLKMTWDIFLAFVRFYLLFVIPLETAFSNKYLYNQLAWTLYTCTALLIFDILVNFITSYYDKGYLITNHFKVAVNYCKNGFIYDVFCVITLVFVMSEELSSQTPFIDYLHQSDRQYNYIRSFISILGIIIQLQNIIRVFQRLQNSQDYSETTSLLIDLLKLVMFLFLLEHLFSCIWYFVGIQDLAENSWIEQQKLKNSAYTEQYITAFYFASVTMFTVGYGDVVPQSINAFYLDMYERLVTIGFMICSTLQLSYTISAIWNVYSKLNEKSEDHIRKMRAINTYMGSVNISTQLRYEIREYLTFYWKEQKLEENMEVKDIINQLSQDLQENLIFEANSIIVEGCKLFKNYFSHEFKAECLKYVQSITLTPCKAVPFDQTCLFFIERGQIGTYFKNNRLRLATLKVGDNFGMREFLLDEVPLLRYTSLAFSKLVFITKKDFMRVIQQYPEDMEQYCQLREEIVYQNSYLGMNCYSCHSQQHQIQGCPLITFKPNIESVVNKHKYPHYQEQKPYFLRHKQRKRRVLLREVKTIENVEKIQLSVPSLQSSDSSEFDLKDSFKAQHSTYFQQISHNSQRKHLPVQGLNIKQIRLKLNHIERKPMQPIEILNLKDYEDDYIRETDKIMLEDLRLKLNTRINFEIDAIKNYKYYYPEFNIQWLFKSIKVNYKFLEQWNKLCHFLTYPNQFIKKYRSYVFQQNSSGSQSKVVENKKKKKRTTVLYFKQNQGK